jgi:hypothetical protein
MGIRTAVESWVFKSCGGGFDEYCEHVIGYWGDLTPTGREKEAMTMMKIDKKKKKGLEKRGRK